MVTPDFWGSMKNKRYRGRDGQPNEENEGGGVPDVVMGDGKLEFRKPSEGV